MERHTSIFKTGRHTHFGISNGETRFNIYMGRHILQNLMWGDTHTSKFVMKRHTSIFKTWRHTLQNLKWRDAFQYLYGETHASKFKMRRHIAKLKMGRHKIKILNLGNTYFKM
jgi:hypothetical protein